MVSISCIYVKKHLIGLMFFFYVHKDIIFNEGDIISISLVYKIFLYFITQILGSIKTMKYLIGTGNRATYL